MNGLLPFQSHGDVSEQNPIMIMLKRYGWTFGRGKPDQGPVTIKDRISNQSVAVNDRDLYQSQLYKGQ